MARQPISTLRNASTVVFSNYSQAFFARVQEDVDEINKDLREEMEGFIDQVLLGIGKDGLPGHFSKYGGDWDPLTSEWFARKKARGFYQGLKGQVERKLRSFDAISAYGEPKVTLPKEQAGVDPTKVKFNEKAERFQYRGRFVSLDKMFRTQLTLELFPKVKESNSTPGLVRPFRGRVRKILSFNEPGPKQVQGRNLEGGRKARPLLTPVYRYYAEEFLPQQVLDRAI